MKIVLCNTVGVDSDGWNIIPYPSRWTTASKGFENQYTYYPRDLAYLSSLLKRDTDHMVKLLDGCLHRYDRETYAQIIIAENPDWLIFENSTRTFNEDCWIAAQVKKVTGAKIIITGQHVSAFPDEGLKHADLVVRGEYLQSLRVFFRDGPDQRRIIDSNADELIDVACLPFPEDDDVSRLAYAKNADMVCEYEEIQIYATRGCPFRCTYCVARHTYYATPQHRKRPIENVIAEIRALGEKYPEVEGFFFDDEIHNVNVKHSKALCRAIIDAGLTNYKYDAMCAYGTFDEELVMLMRQAGYYKVRIGIETASDITAVGMDLKGKHRPGKLKSFLEMARKHGLKVFGTFTLGGPGSTEIEDIKTVDLIEELIGEGLLYDMQVSICTPQPGAPFFGWAKEQGLLDTIDWNRFDGGEDAVISMPGYPAERIKAMRHEALAAYDRARKKRDAARYAKNFAHDFGGLDIASKPIITFRSSREWNLDSFFTALLKQTTDPTHFVCHAPYVERYTSRYPTLNPISVTDDGFLNWDRIPQTTRTELKAIANCIALIPTNTLHCRSMENVVRIAHKAGAEQIYFVNAEGRLIIATK